MEEKKEIKINLKIAIIIACAIIVIPIITIIILLNRIDVSKYDISKTVTLETYNNKDYYVINKDYPGSYDLQYMSSLSSTVSYNKKILMNYDDYKNYCKDIGIKAKYHDASKYYIVYTYTSEYQDIKATLGAVDYKNGNVDLYISDDITGYFGSGTAGYVIIIPTNKYVDNINIVTSYTKSGYEEVKKNLEKYGYPYNPITAKPIIYLYPTQDTEVSVKLLKDNNLTCSYPKYQGEWKVLAQSNGNLKDLTTNRQLYSLYYESKSAVEFNVEEEGFIVKGEDAAAFLEEKLKVLGLNEREAEEFIIYWLPKLEANKFNYIRFATPDEINENMPLEINPNPDTIIRVLMTFKGLDNPIDIKEQKLETPIRKGFIAVEWGGTEIK